MVTAPPSASRLLRVEHAVAEALLAAPSAQDAFPSLLRAVGEGLGWQYGGVWLPVGGGVLHCVATWTAGGEALEHFAMTSRTLVLAPGEGLPGRVQATRAAGLDPRRRDGRELPAPPRRGRGRPARRVRDPARAGGGGAMEFLADRGPRARRGADGDAREPRPAGRAVRRAPPRRGCGRRERGAQASDARRRPGRRDHDRLGRADPRGQRRRRGDLRPSAGDAGGS